MSKRKPRSEKPDPFGTSAPGRDEPARGSRAARVLSVDPDPRVSAELRRALERLGIICDSAGSIAETRAALKASAYDIIVIDELQPDGNALDLVRELASAGPGGGARCIVTAAHGEFEQVVNVVRSGAIDFIAKPFRAGEIAGRILAAIETGRKLRSSERRVERLRRICKRLDSARRDVAEQVDVLCNDLVHAYQELADHMSSAALSNEFASIIRPELDVEKLLRSTLEFLLTRTGPTNAAVFLPTGSRDFNLGAYVNYDVPRDTAEVLLDHLADVIAPRFEQETQIQRISSASKLMEKLGDGAAWLTQYEVVVFSCRHEGDCLAVVALFRDRSNPFPEELLAQLATIRDLFAEQLGRVVRIHHRHKPDMKWPGFDVEDDHGLAA